ncbi:MAG: hypothetical protein M3Q03_09860 [Chloroflexota bacterium]|nr:hypothetical protein [Chloroflexota bacterium]
MLQQDAILFLGGALFGFDWVEPRKCTSKAASGVVVDDRRLQPVLEVPQVYAPTAVTDSGMPASAPIVPSDTDWFVGIFAALSRVPDVVLLCTDA